MDRSNPRLRVALVGGMWLGIRALERLHDDPDVDVVGVAVTPRSESVWWHDVVDEDIATALGYVNCSVESVFDTKPDLVLSMINGSHIFTPDQVVAPPVGIINLHPAPLPEYRGVKSLPQALLRDAASFGATLHYVAEGIDTGAVIAQCSVEIDADDTAGSVYERTMRAADAMIKSCLPRIIQRGLRGERIESAPQDEQRARYYASSDLQDSARQLNGLDVVARERTIRAFTFPPHPPAFDIVDDQRIEWVYDRRSRRSIPMEQAVALGYPKGFAPDAATPGCR